MPWFDTHCHFSPEKGEAALEIIDKAKAVDVAELLVQATSVDDAEYTLALTEQRKGVYAALGLHPHVASQPYDMGFYREQCMSNPKVLAVGELGLDYYYDFAPRDAQRQLFADFLKLAVECGKPVVVHCREAFADCKAIIADNLPAGHPFVIHSFTGTVDECNQWLEMGAMISVNGMVTFKKSDNIRETLAVIPLERLLLETDAPYLAPIPLRGTENTPANIPIIGEFVARQREIATNELMNITTQNAHNFLTL